MGRRKVALHDEVNVSALNTETSGDHDLRGHVDIHTKSRKMYAGASFQKHKSTYKMVHVKGF